MADLESLRQFAAEHGFGLTHPLTHDQVVTLAGYWQPEMVFHPDERFHPISLDERISMVERQFGQIPPNEQEQWQVSKLIRTGSKIGVVRDFDPPLLHIPDGSVQPGELDGFDPAVRVLNESVSILEAFEAPEVNANAVYTHGVSAHRARKFFGAQATDTGEPVGTPGHGLKPRALDDGDGFVTVMATYKNLLEHLKYELLVEEADDYPADGLRGGAEIAGLLLSGPVPLSAATRRHILLELIAAFEESGNLPDLPPGWKLDRRAWDAVTRFAFVEYDYFYAYNDWERFQVTLFDNEHEGDNEGCCLVFDRNLVNLAAAGGDSNQLRRVVPHCIMTCVHEEIQDADLFAFIPPPVPSPDDPGRLPRESMQLTVYAAGGSHATYHTPGSHDVVDFQDFVAYLEEAAGWVPFVLAPGVTLSVLTLLAIIEHFQDTQDFTSDEGVRTGPPEVTDGHPDSVPGRLIMMPMSADEHIYQPQHADLLRLRAYNGKWGANDGPKNKSPAFAPKTGRYFRKLLKNL